jgi:hypothetical protein
MTAVPGELTRFRAYRSDLAGYMERWILQTPWGTLRVHHILRSDDDRALHDHPWAFWSLLLTGGYKEIVGISLKDWQRMNPDAPTPIDGGDIERHTYWPRFSLVRRKAEDAHRLELTSGPVWTLVWTGPFKRQWGFHTDDGWVSYETWRAQHPEKAWSQTDDEKRKAALNELPRGNP